MKNNADCSSASCELLKDIPEVLFVTGIGTDVGKSWATGWLAREAAKVTGEPVITQKMIQTGNHDMSEDIAVHREVMGCGLLPRDLDHTTAPLILSYPASPDLASRIDGVDIDYSVATGATKKLLREYRHVIVEGAGGLMVPLKGRYITLDYLKEQKLPVAVVINGQLGSINHTLLTLEMLRMNCVKVYAVVYNPHFDRDRIICDDTRVYVRSWLRDKLPDAKYIEMPANI